MVLSDTSKGKLGWKKWFITSWAFMECLLFSGLLYGWGSVNFVLKMEGIYSDLCDDEIMDNATDVTSNLTFPTTVGIISSKNSSTTDVLVGGYMKRCKHQDQKMALCYTIAATMFGAGCFFAGFINYRLGIRTTRLIGFAMFVPGSLMMAFVSKENPWLMFPGFALVSLGGLPVMLTNVQVAYLFTAGGSTVVGLLNGGFSTSTVVMLALKIAHEHGFMRRYMFILIAVLHCLVLTSTFYFLPKYFIVQHVQPEENHNVEKAIKPANIDKSMEQKEGILTLKSCLLSSKYFTHLIWFAILNLRFQYFIGTLNQYLTRVLHDEDQVSHFTDVCFYIMLSGLVLSFLAGAIYDSQKRICKDGKSPLYREMMPGVLPLGLTCTFAVLMSILVLIPVTELLYVIFIVMSIYRGLLYCLGAAFIRSIFPSQYYALMYGVVMIVGAMVATLQYTHYTWAVTYDDGPFQANLFLLCLTCLSFIHPLYWWIKCKRDENLYKTEAA